MLKAFCWYYSFIATTAIVCKWPIFIFLCIFNYICLFRTVLGRAECVKYDTVTRYALHLDHLHALLVITTV